MDEAILPARIIQTRHTPQGDYIEFGSSEVDSPHREMFCRVTLEEDELASIDLHAGYELVIRRVK